MPNKDAHYQTIGEFLNSPFGTKDRGKADEYDKSYKEMVQKKTIYCENYTELDDTYLIHVKIPSESKPGLWYDVVIQFFTDDETTKKSLNLANYYIQFYSNSPSFIYQYAALYRLYGYLIDSLYDKTDDEYSIILPEKANPNMKMSYDKSIYIACKYLYDNKFTYLRKTGIHVIKKVKWNAFMRSIKEYALAKADSDLYSLEKEAKKETAKEKERAKKARQDRINSLNPFSSKNRKIKAKNDTIQDGEEKGIIRLIKRKPVNSTSQNQSSIRVNKKKSKTLSTRKK